jgi:putative dimethyl sulfoxide reductase chaperone
VIDTNMLAEAASRRSVVYWTLSELFLTCPDTSFVERLRQILRPGPLSGTSGQLTKHLRAIRRTLPRDPSGVEILAVEYTRAFGAVSPAYGLPAPYQSVHLQSDAPAEVRAGVSRFYLDAGLMLVDSAAPPDHLGVELKFLSLLCHNETKAWRAGKDEVAVRLLGQQSNFHNNHLMSWVPQYLAMLRARSNHPLYKNVALLALEIVTEHDDSCKEALRQFEKEGYGARSGLSYGCPNVDDCSSRSTRRSTEISRSS